VRGPRSLREGLRLSRGRQPRRATQWAYLRRNWNIFTNGPRTPSSATTNFGTSSMGNTAQSANPLSRPAKGMPRSGLQSRLMHSGVDRATARKSTGHSPFYMAHGIEPVLPFNITAAQKARRRPRGNPLKRLAEPLRPRPEFERGKRLGHKAKPWYIGPMRTQSVFVDVRQRQENITTSRAIAKSMRLPWPSECTSTG
jgi:hypothetical protein